MAPLVVGFRLDLTLPGVHEALAAVERERGSALTQVADWPVTSRADLLREEGAVVHVGDHADDMAQARAAGAVGVAVLTGAGGTRAGLEAAGAEVVLDDLHGFPAWLGEHLLTTRLAALADDLGSRGSLLVAFSGGADSALLLAAAVRALGAGRVAAATAYSDSLPEAERGPAREFAESLGVRVLTPRTREMERAGYRANSGERCYFCKAELLDVLAPLAEQEGFAHVATGTNADDAVAGFRPGIRAAAERGALTPLQDAGLTKAQVREVSRRWQLPTWDKPAAACLSSRIAYGLEVSPSRLARVERAETVVRLVLADHGLVSADLRVRDVGDRASVELDARLVEADLGEGAPARRRLLDAVRDAGFAEAVLDPRGFRSGSLNDALSGGTA